MDFFIKFIIIFYLLFFYLSGVKKKISAVAKLRDCENVKLWQKSIVNHIYWTAMSTPSGDGALMEAKFLSITNHIVNKHEGHGHKDFDRCEHEEMNREWLREGNHPKFLKRDIHYGMIRKNQNLTMCLF